MPLGRAYGEGQPFLVSVPMVSSAVAPGDTVSSLVLLGHIGKKGLQNDWRVPIWAEKNFT